MLAGIVGDRLIGPYVLPPRLNSIILLEDVSLNVMQYMMFQHDRAPAHFSLASRQ